MKKLGPLSYLTNGQNRKCHIDQLLPLQQQVEIPSCLDSQLVVVFSNQSDEDFFVPTVPALSTETQSQNDNPVHRNPPRARKHTD